MKIGSIDIAFRPEFGNERHFDIVKKISRLGEEIVRLELKKKLSSGILALEKRIKSIEREIVALVDGSIKK